MRSVRHAWFVCGGFILATLVPAVRAGEPGAGPDRAKVEFFEAKVRPVLANNCFGCHGPEKQKGNLRLDSISTMRSGGDSGPAIVPGDPEQSLLIEAVRYEGAVQMPPKKKLEEGEVGVLVEWVKQGAHWPETEAAPRSAAAPASRTITAEDRAFWSFQPVKDVPAPAVKDRTWATSSIDTFILAKLEEKGLRPSPAADNRTLIRRATFDLIGLPPTPEEIEAFLNDSSADAFAKVVDRLLASPHYGERWARHWLDVARYGEDQAHSFQPRLYPQGFRYRDWLISAFNADMPYNRFILEQIAGDLLEERGRWERQPALGFFALGPVYYGDAKKLDQIDDRVDTMSRGFLGLTVACARCHDHKYDPIPTADYYALAGVFASTEYEEAPFASPEQVEAYDRAQAAIKDTDKAISTIYNAGLARTIEPRVAEIDRSVLAVWTLKLRQTAEPQLSIEEFANQEGLDSALFGRWVAYLSATEKTKELPQLRPWLEFLARHAPSADLIGDEAVQGEVEAIAGAFAKTVQSLLARPEVVSVLVPALAAKQAAGSKAAAKKLNKTDQALLDDLCGAKGLLGLERQEQGIKLALAREEADKLGVMLAELKQREQSAPAKYPVTHTLKEGAKPLDMHVLVRGNPDTPGPEAPRRFLSILGGDKVRFTHGSGRLELAQAIASSENPLTPRVIVNRIWQHHFGRGLVGTPSNLGVLGERPSHPELLDHLAYQFSTSGWSIKAMHRAIMLSASYQQSARFDPHSQEIDPENRLLWHMSRRRLEVEAWRDAMLAVAGRLDPTIGGESLKLDSAENRRRTLYAVISRHDLAPLLRLFDFPDPNITSAERSRTTVPLQQLLVLNGEFMVENAKALVTRLKSSAADGDPAQIQAAYLLLFGRPATEPEVQLGLEYLGSPEADKNAPGDLSRWERYAQALLGTNEFLFVD
ncbi:MAG TPA: PSD1 and planctomycete cytochrome C domain-containing protein [Isosphaeraceae bacterium]|jgi:mono/diheme cytochrome c family protein|nr:PSD1 and planctomycete cytochrome C domain-containing protein [Isosphaeraceae bacterium]